MDYAKEENAPFGLAIKAFSAVMVLSALVLVALSLRYAALAPLLQTLVFAAIALTLVSLWLFFALKFGFDGKRVFARMGPFSYSIPRSQITCVSLVENIPFWAGWGVRVWWWKGFTLAFVSKHKPSLLMEKKTGFFKRVLFSVENPRAFARKAGLRISQSEKI